MFGYVTVCEPELKVKDLKKYRAYYCGLCRTLKEDYGFMGQMTLTYDMTFAVILLSSLYETIAKHEERRCKVHPVKRQHMLRNEITSYAAAMNVLLAYYHMEDDWQDDRKVSSLMTKSLIQGKAKKTIEKYPRQSEIIRKSLDNYGYILVADTMDDVIDIANEIASEHLEIQTKNPYDVMTKVRNAGAIFMGEYSSEPLGDYFAGPNHTLPTSGTARFSSPLGVDDFVKKSSFIYYTRDALGKVQSRIADFAEHEGLHAHAKSVTIRFEDQ